MSTAINARYALIAESTNFDYYYPYKMKKHEPISKIRLGFRARHETVKKRSIHVVCEHFEPVRNAAMGF